MSRAGSSDRRTRGALLRLTGPFVLAPGLASPGDLPVALAVALVTADWDAQVVDGRVLRHSVLTLSRPLGQFGSWCAAKGLARVADVTPVHVQTWCTRALLPPVKGRPAKTGQVPANGTQRIRLNAVSAFSRSLRRLGLDNRDLTADLIIAKPDTAFSRPLTDKEAARCRALARRTPADTHNPAVLALSLAGGSQNEVAAASVADLHLEDGIVWLHGNKNQVPRWAALDPWAVAALRSRVTRLSDDHGPDVPPATLLVYKPKGPRWDNNPDNKDYRPVAAIGMSLTKILRAAGLHHLPGVTPTSVHLNVALRAYADTGRVEAVAARLGIASLDAAAFVVGADATWRDEFTLPGPQPQPAPGDPS